MFPRLELQELLKSEVRERQHAPDGLRSDFSNQSPTHLRCLEFWYQYQVEVLDEEERGLAVQLVDKVFDPPTHSRLRLLHPVALVPVLLFPCSGNEVVKMMAESLYP